MDLTQFPYLILLCLCSCLAGFMDAIIGGGGMVQLPAVIAFLPGILGLPLTAVPITMLVGTNKLASIFGTGLAGLRYSRHMDIPFKKIMPMVVSAGISSAIGAHYLGVIPRQVSEIIVFTLMVVVAVVIIMEPLKSAKNVSASTQNLAPNMILLLFWGMVVGFYDGFFGPGTGIILVLILSRLFSWQFLLATASAKIVNLATNFGALVFLLWHNQVAIKIGLSMAAFNILGAWLGAGYAMKIGASMLRQFSLIIIGLLLTKISWNWFFK